MIDGPAHAGLGAEVDDPVDPVGGQRRFEAGGIGEILTEQGEAGAFERGGAGLLQIEAVIGGEAIQPDDGFAARQQGPADGRSDEAGCACDKSNHYKAGWRTMAA